MKNLIALILTIAAVGLFYSYVGPTYEEIKALRVEKAEYDKALGNSQKVQDMRDVLMEKYRGFSPNDLKRLEKLLPDNVDNIRLIIEIDFVAARYNMILKNVQISAPTATAPSDISGQILLAETASYGKTQLSFEVTGSYEMYRSFIKDLEKSLRVLDITGISFTPGQEQKDIFNMYSFKTTLQTYWLQQK
jgi:Tfp pilus assembly protein PilO